METARRISASQHGVVARRQLLAAGIPQGTIDSRIYRGELFRLLRGTYAVGRRSIDLNGAFMAAVLAAGPGSAVSHESAALAWGIYGSDPAAPGSSLPLRVDVTRPSSSVTWSCSAAIGGIQRQLLVRAHSSGTVHGCDVTPLQAIPTTAIPRTLIDLAGALSEARLRHVFIEADRLGLIDDAAFSDALGRSRTKPGTGTLRGLVRDRHPDVRRTRSVLEALLQRLCLESGLTDPISNMVISGREIDFVWPSERVAVELDGYRFHRGREKFDEDARRMNDLASDGWVVLRFTWRIVNREPRKVVAQIREALRQRRVRTH